MEAWKCNFPLLQSAPTDRPTNRQTGGVNAQREVTFQIIYLKRKIIFFVNNNYILEYNKDFYQSRLAYGCGQLTRLGLRLTKSSQQLTKYPSKGDIMVSKGIFSDLLLLSFKHSIILKFKHMIMLCMIYRLSSTFDDPFVSFSIIFHKYDYMKWML